MARILSPTAPALAALLLLCGAVSAAEAPVSAKAQAHFEAGVAHLEGQAPERYNDAYREFRAAYAASPSWKILGNLGIAAQNLERYGEAGDAFAKYLELGGKQVTLREAVQVKRDLERLRAELVTVAFDAGPEPYWIVDTRVVDGGDAIVNHYGPFEGRAELRVRSGQHEFQMERGGQNVPAWSVALRPGEASTHAFQATPEPLEEPDETASPEAGAEEPDLDPAGRSRTLSYVLWGGGAATAIAATAFYFRGQSVQVASNRDFARTCPRGVEPGPGECGLSSTPGDARAANWKTAALFTGIGAVGMATAGAVLYWVDFGANEESLEAVLSPTGVMLRGSF